MPPSSSLLLGRSHAGAWWLALQLAIGVMLCLYAWQAMGDAYLQRSAPNGIDDTNVLVVPWMEPAPGHDPGSRAVLRTLRAVPGVRSAAAGNQSPYGTSAWSAHVWREHDAAHRELATVYLADEQWMATLHLTPSHGRRFSPGEYQDYTGDQRRLHADPSPVIISTALAERLFGGDAPLGRAFQLMPGKRLRVVGVVRDMPLPATAHRRDGTALILPVRMTQAGEAHFFVRHGGAAEVMATRVRAALAATYPDAVIASPVNLQALREQASRGAMRHAWTSFAACAAWWLSTVAMLVLGGQRWVQEHRQEISLRRAFGATGVQLARRLRVEYLLLAGAAAIGGVMATLWPRWAMLPSIPSPWMSVAVIAGTVLVVQLAATWPIRQARRIPPHLVSRSPSVRL